MARVSERVRYVAVSQVRRTTDVPFGKIGDVFNYIFCRDGYTVYTLFGKSSAEDDYHTLSGPCIELSQSEYRQLYKSLQALDSELDDQEFETLFDELAVVFSSKRDMPGCGLSAIELRRDGKIEISFADIPFDEAQDVASQIYFFVRDVCHVHQHHAPTSDTILDVVPIDEGDNHWKRETLYSLYRWVIQQKRSKNPVAYVDAKGVLAYASAFTQMHCAEPFDRVKLPNYLREATIESLDAGLKRADYIDKNSAKIANAIFNKTIPLLGVILAFLSLFYIPPSESNLTAQQILLSEFVGWFNANIILVIATLIFTIVVANISIVFRSRIFMWSLWLDFFRLIFPIPYSVVIIVLLILSLGFSLLAIQEFLELKFPLFNQI